LVSILKEYIFPNITIGVHCTLEDIWKIQNQLKENFLYKKIRPSCRKPWRQSINIPRNTGDWRKITNKLTNYTIGKI